ncbi:hypothetical protein [Sphingomonas hankookensis]|uniref:hypothetical protein n=1 Tax=Sphingomonas hankookensis TaxID=563996 RepID=UPI003D301E15
MTRRLPAATEGRMATLFDTVFNQDDHALSRDELAAAMADCDVLVPAVTDAIDAALIAAAPDRLRLIANYGAGVNHIDLKAAHARRILVTNTPGVLTEDTADMVMALILAVPRRLAEGRSWSVRASGRGGVRAACWATASAARRWASSAWVASDRPSPAAPARSA